MDGRIGSRFDAAAIAVGGLILGDPGVAKASDLLIGGEQPDILARGALVALATQAKSCCITAGDAMGASGRFPSGRGNPLTQFPCKRGYDRLT